MWSVCAVAWVGGCGRSDAPVPVRMPPELLRKASESLASGRYDEAAVQLERIVQNWPVQIEARRQLAYALAALGRFDEVDRILRTAPADQPSTLMPLRRAFNIYRYYYHTDDPAPEGVFRVGAIRDALDAAGFDDMTVSENPTLPPLALEELIELFWVWVRWDQVTRDPDSAPLRQWMPLWIVAESQRLADRTEALRDLEHRTGGDVWMHPDDQGNWLIHSGAVGMQDAPSGKVVRPPRNTDVFTETAESAEGLVEGWRSVMEWLRRNLPDATVVAAASIRSGPDQPFDHRLVLWGRIRGVRFSVDRMAMTTGPVEVLCLGYAEYRRLRGAQYVTARSVEELEALARAYAAAGLPATAFSVDERQRIVAEDPVDLACLLSLVRYGAKEGGQEGGQAHVFEPPVP